jgi:hypothetical protein
LAARPRLLRVVRACLMASLSAIFTALSVAACHGEIDSDDCREYDNMPGEPTQIVVENTRSTPIFFNTDICGHSPRFELEQADGAIFEPSSPCKLSCHFSSDPIECSECHTTLQLLMIGPLQSFQLSWDGGFFETVVMRGECADIAQNDSFECDLQRPAATEMVIVLEAFKRARCPDQNENIVNCQCDSTATGACVVPQLGEPDDPLFIRRRVSEVENGELRFVVE